MSNWMSLLLVMTFTVPLAGTAVLAFSRGRWSETASAAVGVSTVGVAALATLGLYVGFLSGPGEAQSLTLWTWISVGQFQPTIGLALDGLSITMLGVITGVGFLIHLFASWYMRGEDGITRFFAYMNLFVFSMVLLVLGDNVLLLYLGWEGVGLCSYLLIGYYYKTSANGWAAFKAFIVTRLGDVFLAIGLFLIFRDLGTLNIAEILERAPVIWGEGDPMVTWAALLILGGAVGKSAQLPLHTWLADAMAGPTPVSALIHAATMVTAGVYLIARLNGIFLLAPEILELVGVVGAMTLLIAGFAALAQTDIKRVLAYSTMSQIGYMFLALGVGAFDAAIFHLMTHAFFKALLFLSAGAVIVSCHHEQDMRRLGGLWRTLPLPYMGFVVGGAALAALPLITAGFFSKDEILWQEFAAGNVGFLTAGLVGAVLTSIYTVRLVIGIFHGEPRSEAAEHAEHGRGFSHGLPLVALAALSTFLGGLLHPPAGDVLPPSPGAGIHEGHLTLEIMASGITLAALSFALWLFITQRALLARAVQRGIGRTLWELWNDAWGFDGFYHRAVVRPYQALVHGLRSDWLDRLLALSAWVAKGLNAGLTRTQNGQLRAYATWMVGGSAVVLVLLMVWA